jgi:hypothetical protein
VGSASFELEQALLLLAKGLLAGHPQVDGDMTVDTLKAILEAECGVPSAQQALVVNNRILKDR